MKRVWSIALLTFREAVHSKAFLSCVFFAVVVVLVRTAVFAVGGRELWVNVEQFTRLALLLMLLTGVAVTVVVVSPSLAHDIKSKVIYTVVPKPIHRVEILLGKVLGFAAMGAAILLAAGLVTLVTVLLTVPAKGKEGLRNPLAAEVLVPATSIRFEGGSIPYMKRSSRRWLNPYVRPEDQPPAQKMDPVSVKFEPGRAIVTFENIRPEDLRGNPLRFQLRLGVNKYGGGAGRDPEIGVIVVNRGTGERRIVGRRDIYDEESKPFIIRENAPMRILVPADFIGGGATVDLIVRNFTPMHRVGIERTDVTLLLADRSYTANFFKSLFILFWEVFLVVVVGVMASTFLGGPVAVMFTGVVWVAGHMIGWMGTILERSRRIESGPIMDITQEFHRGVFVPEGPLDWVFGFANSILEGVLYVVAHVFPNLGRFDSAWLLARNVDITGALVWRAAQFSLLYSAACFVVAYVCFRAKEVAK